ncbi:cell division protein ZipA [Halomonas sp. LS-001]
MELREWLIILGLALVSLIVVDGARRLQRQRKFPRLDQAGSADDDGADPEEAERVAELSWELPNGGARVVKPADYSSLSSKPKLKRQEHPGPSKVLSEFRRKQSASASHAPAQGAAHSGAAQPSPESVNVKHTRSVKNTQSVKSTQSEESHSPPLTSSVEPEKIDAASEAPLAFGKISALDDADDTVNAKVSTSDHAPAAPADQGATVQSSTVQSATVETSDKPHLNEHLNKNASANTGSTKNPHQEAAVKRDIKRRQLRSSTVGEYSDEEDLSYQLVDFEGIRDSFKHRMVERIQDRKQKKIDKEKRKEQLKKEKAQRAAEAEKLKEQRAYEEAQRRREAQALADAQEAERARQAQEQAERLKAQHEAAAADRDNSYDDRFVDADEETLDESYAADEYYDDVVRPHPTLAKAIRNDVSGKHAGNTLQSAEEVVVISVMSRDENGFEGAKLLELLMMCGLRYSSHMGIFHRLETEHPESELQFSMVNVVKPGTFPIQEMDEFVTPGVTFLMPLPGSEDSSAAFEAMVETAMVVVRHMGGELKDENHSVMTAQTIEFARQRVHDFERRHRLHRHMQAH